MCQEVYTYSCVVNLIKQLQIRTNTRYNKNDNNNSTTMYNNCKII